MNKWNVRSGRWLEMGAWEKMLPEEGLADPPRGEVYLGGGQGAAAGPSPTCAPELCGGPQGWGRMEEAANRLAWKQGIWTTEQPPGTPSFPVLNYSEQSYFVKVIFIIYCIPS